MHMADLNIRLLNECMNKWMNEQTSDEVHSCTGRNVFLSIWASSLYLSKYPIRKDSSVCKWWKLTKTMRQRPKDRNVARPQRTQEEKLGRHRHHCTISDLSALHTCFSLFSCGPVFSALPWEIHPAHIYFGVAQLPRKSDSLSPPQL